jgi:hypothetical protein
MGRNSGKKEVVRWACRTPLDLATMSTLKLKPAFNEGDPMQEFEIQSMTCGAAILRRPA